MLYRKYRPKKFKDVEGQAHVIKTLQGALTTDSVGHAYLFAGPRGTGKTTMARLLAKALNCEKRGTGTEPCNNCTSCIGIDEGRSLDLIEVDAASNRGIDEIRNIRESAQVSASAARKKIFIIDEVHMLTTAAFNALLKTLEEPPAHVHFVMATTEPHKVLDTILSRVQRFDFHASNLKDITRKLNKIAKAEALTVDDDALDAIARSANGSLRDAESAFAKVIAFAEGGKITADSVAAILGIVSSQEHQKLLDTILAKDAQTGIEHITHLYQTGVHLDDFIAQFIGFVRTKLLEVVESKQHDRPLSDYVRIVERCMTARADLKSTPIPTLPLELAIIDLTA